MIEVNSDDWSIAMMSVGLNQIKEYALKVCIQDVMYEYVFVHVLYSTLYSIIVFCREKAALD